MAIAYNQKIRDMIKEFGFIENGNTFTNLNESIILPNFLQVIDYINVRTKLVEGGYITENDFNKIFFFLKYD